MWKGSKMFYPQKLFVYESRKCICGMQYENKIYHFYWGFVCVCVDFIYILYTLKKCQSMKFATSWAGYLIMPFAKCIHT